MQRMIAVSLAVVVQVGMFSFEVRANNPPNSAAQASSEFGYRRDNMVRRLVVQFTHQYGRWQGRFKHEDWGRDPDEDGHDKTIRRAQDRVVIASAVLWVLSHPSDFINGTDDAYYLLQNEATGHTTWDNDYYLDTWDYWVGNRDVPYNPIRKTKRITRLFESVYRFAEDGCKSTKVEVGTKCDYDFVLIALANLLYTFRDGEKVLDDPKLFGPNNPVPHPQPGVNWTFADFLTNDMIYNIICQGPSEYDPLGIEYPVCEYWKYRVPYAFFDLDDDLALTRWVGIGQAETENHVLNIVAYDYLITNFVMWQGNLGFLDRRYEQRMKDLRIHKSGTWGLHANDIYERALRVSGRVLHSGMYEANARPYGRVSLNALLTLANFANPFSTPPNGVDFWPSEVQNAARNAVDYLSAKLAFQSLRGKRQGPYRRASNNKKFIDFYHKNGFVRMMSLLSGAYEWDDCIHERLAYNPADPNDPLNGKPECPILRWDTLDSLPDEYATMVSSAVGGYRIPRVIHEQMFDRESFYARMKTRYTRDHMPISPPEPEYFVSDTQAFNAGDDRSSFELYFGDNNILLSAGGSHISYYAGEGNDTWAKPTMLIPRGDFGHIGAGDDAWEWRETDNNGVGDAADDVLLSRGRAWKWPSAECNVWQYRNFVYGYTFHDKGVSDLDPARPSWSRQHTFEVPEFWGAPKGTPGTANMIETFKIDDAHFEIYQFDGPEKLIPTHAQNNISALSGDGYFIVRARFRKKAALNALYRRHREYKRGLLEIVPRSAFADALALATEIQSWNNIPGQFSGDHRNEPWAYVLTMSKELVEMSSVMGSNSVGGEACSTGIIGIREYNWWSNSWKLQVIDMLDLFLPYDVGYSHHKKYIPLITVWELDDSFEATGCRLVETVDEGAIVIRQPAEVCGYWDVLTYPPTCRYWIPGYRCLKLNSHNYKHPARQPDVPFDADYEHGYVESPTCDCFSP